MVGELRSHMPQDEEACKAQQEILSDATKIPHATTKARHSQVNKQVDSKRQEKENYQMATSYSYSVKMGGHQFPRDPLLSVADV